MPSLEELFEEKATPNDSGMVSGGFMPRLAKRLSFNSLSSLKKGKLYSLLPQSSDDLPNLNVGRFASSKFRGPSLFSRLFRWCVLLCVALFVLALGNSFFAKPKGLPIRKPHKWEKYMRVNSYYNGLKTIVPIDELEPEYPAANVTAEAREAKEVVDSAEKLHPTAFNPYPKYDSEEYLKEYRPVQKCYLDAEKTLELPMVYNYLGVPQYSPDPLLGSYKVLGLRDDVCFERFGRYGPYGFGYSTIEGGTGEGLESEFRGSDQVWKGIGGHIDWHAIDWAEVQNRCHEQNKNRFRKDDEVPNVVDPATGLKAASRQAILVRTWTGFEFTPHVILNFRAMITELALHSGGEYTIHFLVHVKDDHLPIYANDEVYNKVLNSSVPEEFRGMVTLWSEKQMQLIYAAEFGETFDNPSHTPIHGVYRSPHLPMQYFAAEHPEYDYFWNWEMDMRYTGHFYEFFDRLAKFGAEQPRKGIWERSAKYYIPSLHGTWENFTELVTRENEEGGNREILGPIVFPGSGRLEVAENTMPPSCAIGQPIARCGVGEEADLITLNPIFDPNGTKWFFENDVTGYDIKSGIPPRRTAIVTAGRLSKRLLHTMHEETYKHGRTMFPEMWAPSVALHHGLKAVYAPHPVFFDRKWPLEEAEHIFNGGKFGSTGGNESSVFGQWEHNFQGSSWYYNSGFAGALWRRWLGYPENGEGGREAEVLGMGRMCLRSVLVHPIKFENGPALKR